MARVSVKRNALQTAAVSKGSRRFGIRVARRRVCEQSRAMGVADQHRFRPSGELQDFVVAPCTLVPGRRPPQPAQHPRASP